MTSEAILGLIILALLVERYLSQKAIQLERKEWTKGMLAKDLRELTDNEALEKIPKQPEPEVPADFVSMDDATEDVELFDRHLQAVKAAAKEEIRKEHEV